jgi:hypothetical protein
MNAPRRLEAVPTAGLPDPPYPADTRARGWKFELDLERIVDSDTWSLASPDLRPWLLMLWAMSWRSTPTGSLPDDDRLVAARIGMPVAMFQTHRETLLRGWIRHADGRLYHDVITERVLSMLAFRNGEKRRQADWRAKKNQRVSEKTTSTNALVTRYYGVNTPPEPELVPEPKDNPPYIPPLIGGGPEAVPVSKSKAKRKRRDPNLDGLTFVEWVEDCKAKGVERIPATDPVHEFARKAGLPAEYVRLAWIAFRREWGPREKRYLDWRATFRNAVEGNWGKLWYATDDGGYALTTKGKQLERVTRADDSEAGRA